jgi:PAS domain S-box-containing protein
MAERKRVEEALARSVAVIEAAHEAGGLGVWSYDFATQTVEGDERAKALFGLAAEGPLARQDWLGAVHPDDLSAVHAELDRATAARGDFRAEFRVVRPGADVAWVLAFGRVSYDPADDHALWMTGVFFNITKRRVAEEALRESRNRFEAAVQAVEGILWTNNARGEMEGEQPGWAALTGQTAEEYQGSGWSNAVHPEDAGPTVVAWNEALAEGRIFSFEHRVRTSGGAWRSFAVRAIPVRGADGQLREWVGVHTDVTARKEAEERQALLIRELHHRVKNTLATVQAIVSATARSAETIEDFYQGFVGRIVSLAHTHNLLTDDDWQTASLRQLLESELGPYDDASGRRVALDGPAVELPSDAAVPIGMAIHELTTNAAKHGALSAPDGRVEVRWSAPERDGGAVLAFAWTEEGGPPVGEPTRQGFGSRLLRRVLATQLGATVTIDFDPAGLRFRMEAPLARGPAPSPPRET